ncbi:MAG: YdcF family protein, partial [Solobacterium sp.]|nr:YdcF family protein [Solobacterium sp.]
MRLLLSAAALIGLFLCLIPVFTAAVFNLGTATGLAVFGLVLLYGLFPRQLMALFHKLPAFCRVVLTSAAVIILALTVLISALMVKACTQKPQEDCTVVVLGCEVIGDRPSLMLVERLEAARAFLAAHPGSSAVLSGGMGSTEEISEAEAMYRWLTARGIDPSRLYKEDRSESTRQNLQYSLEIIRENGLPEH